MPAHKEHVLCSHAVPNVRLSTGAAADFSPSLGRAPEPAVQSEGGDRMNLAFVLPPEADQNFQRQNVLWKDVISVGQGSSALVFNATILDNNGDKVPVVIKERRQRSTQQEDEEVLYPTMYGCHGFFAHRVAHLCIMQGPLTQTEPCVRPRCLTVPALVQEQELFYEELMLSAKLIHRNVLFCYGGYVAPRGSPFPAPHSEPDFILFERCAASLSHYVACRYDEHAHASLNPFWLQEVLDIGFGIFSTLQYLHPKVTHGDISSSNVLMRMETNHNQIRAMSVVLADFETACVWEPLCRLYKQKGTAAFMPPSDDEQTQRDHRRDDGDKCEQFIHQVCLGALSILPFLQPFQIMQLNSPRQCVQSIGHKALALFAQCGHVSWHDSISTVQMRDVYSVSMVMFHAMTGQCPFATCVDDSQVNQQAKFNRMRYGTLLPLPQGLPSRLRKFFETCWAVPWRQQERDPAKWVRSLALPTSSATVYHCLLLVSICCAELDHLHGRGFFFGQDVFHLGMCEQATAAAWQALSASTEQHWVAAS
jgi:serine/threonine protein kinase